MDPDPAPPLFIIDSDGALLLTDICPLLVIVPLHVMAPLDMAPAESVAPTTVFPEQLMEAGERAPTDMAPVMVAEAAVRAPVTFSAPFTVASKLVSTRTYVVVLVSVPRAKFKDEGCINKPV